MQNKMKQVRKPNITGFTLIELSIVIVIIGLIVAGVTAGQSLISQARVKLIGSEIEQIKTMYNAFELQYGNLPGDIPNANSFWSGCNSGASAAECNGDGDRLIEYGSSDSDREFLRAWQHLELADFISGPFLGTGSSPYTSDEQYYSTTDRVKFSIITRPGNQIFSTGGTAENRRDITMTLSEAYSTVSAVNNDIAALTLLEALNIDQKYDDGIANRGKIYAVDGFYQAANSCSAARGTDGGADFNTSNLTSGSELCILHVFLKR